MPKFGFDVNEVEANEPINYDPLPKGEYTLRGVEAELKDTKNNAGSYIAVKYEVSKGEYEGRLIWFNFNVTNASQQAETIGRQQLVAWATACGKPDCDDTDMLMEKPFQANVGIRAGTNGYADKNEISGFLFKPTAKPRPAPKSAPVETPSSSAKPWD
jgi:hypothetical protein